MAHCLNKKKTILRIRKRKFAAIEAADTIVLSQPSIKKPRSITSDELNKAFFDGFKIVSNDEDIKNDQNERKPIPNYFDFEQQQNQKRVFKLIPKDSIKRAFQSNNFHQQSSDRRKSNILKQRRTKRENYFKNIREEIKSQNQPQNILQHEDFSNDDNEEEEPTNHQKCKSNQHIDFVKQRQSKLDHFKNKLLEKQKASRSTKIATKRQMQERQKQLTLRNQQNNGKKSAFCNDWNKNPMDLEDEHRGIDITEMDSLEPPQYDIIEVEYDDKRQKYVQNKHASKNAADDDEYDYYELVEDADPDQVIAAIQMMKERQKQKEQEREREAVEQEEKMGDIENGNELDLEWKLEKIKNKHLRFHKHFDKTYEGPTYGIQHQSKDSEVARYIEIEQEEFTKDDCFDDLNEIQRHFENLENDEEELEREDENYIDNDYPDENDMSDFYRDDDNDNFYGEDNEDELGQYDLFDQTDNYDPNSLGLDFFNQYKFN